MPSANLILQQHKLNRKGEAPISVRVIVDRKPSYKSTGIRLNPDHWDEKKERVKSSFKNSVQLNTVLQEKLSDAQKSLNTLTLNGRPFRVNEVFTETEGKQKGLLEYSNIVLSRNRNRYAIGTYNRYKAVISKVEQYLNEKDIPISSVTVTWLRDYESYLLNELGNSVNTVGSNLKVLRTVLSEAAVEGIINHTSNPFTSSQFKIKSKKTEIVYLTDDELKRFEEVQLPEGSRMKQHQDLYLFACYTAGIRIGDLLTLDWSIIDGDILRISTTKTIEPIGIKLTGKAESILKRQDNYNRRRGLVFGLISESVNLEDETQRTTAISRINPLVNKNLRKIAERANIEKHLHFHTSRHTFALKALRAGVPIVNLSKLLGHSDIRTTMIYLKIENSDLQKSMEIFDASC